MKKYFQEVQPEDLPVSLLLSLPLAKPDEERQDGMALKEKNSTASAIHQNQERTVFEGFYKSITRKIRS